LPGRIFTSERGELVGGRTISIQGAANEPFACCQFLVSKYVCVYYLQKSRNWHTHKHTLKLNYWNCFFIFYYLL